MTKTIAQRELRNDNAGVIAAVVAGETFVVTRNGEPVAEIRPIRRTRRYYVSKVDVVWSSPSGPRLDASAFRADLDRAIDQYL